MDATVPAGHDRSRYEGKNLLLLLLALFGPAFVLFLQLALSIIVRASSLRSGQSIWMGRLCYGILAVFFLLEIFCARYVQRLLRPATTAVRDALQYVAVFALCLFTSYCAAVICEAFGYEVLLRLSQPR
jgi:hypothetical protein